jgi:hypothetical protein
VEPQTTLQKEWVDGGAPPDGQSINVVEVDNAAVIGEPVKAACFVLCVRMQDLLFGC